MKRFVWTVLFAAGTTGAFLPPLVPSHISRHSLLLVDAKKRKKGDLAWLAQEEEGSSPRRPPPAPKKKRKTTTTGKSSGGETKVSSALAEWAAQDTTTTTTTLAASDNAIDSSTTTTAAADEFVPFVADDEKPKGRRRVRQSERFEQSRRQNKAVQKVVKELRSVLEDGKNNLDEILATIEKMLRLKQQQEQQQQQQQQQASELKLLTGSKERSNYRLAWVGSDDAICHIGTGLHKIALARMQEVFLLLQGRNRLEIYEVISVLGPFPNVRNTLQGSCQVAIGKDNNNNNNNDCVWKLSYDSMIDGTGKELLAGKDENVRKVDLQIAFADANAIVAVVPNPDGLRSNPLEENGKHVLVFVRQDDLDSELERLRVL